MVMYDNDFEIKEKQKLIELKNQLPHITTCVINFYTTTDILWLYGFTPRSICLWLTFFFVFKFVCFCIILFIWLMVIFLLVCREEIWDKLPKDNRQVTLLVFR